MPELDPDEPPPPKRERPAGSSRRLSRRARVVYFAIVAIAVAGVARAAIHYLRAPIDSVWPPRLDTDAQQPLPRLPHPITEPANFSLIDLPPRPGMWAREGELAGLRYLEVVFGEGVDPDSELPLLVALHGRGDRPRVPGAPFDRLGRPVRVVMPAGPDRLGDGFAWIPYYVLQGRTAELAGSARVAGALLADFLRAFMAERPTFGSPLVSGFSQGGILTWVLAVEHPELIEAAFPLSTWLPPPLLPRPGLDRSYPRIRSLHGEDDRTIPLGPTLESIHALRGGGVVVDFEVFPGVEHYISRDMALRHEEFLREALEAMFLRLTVEPPDGGADAGPGAGSFATLDGG